MLNRLLCLFKLPIPPTVTNAHNVMVFEANLSFSLF